ncbi:MAG: NADH:flavin oxidoreductase/NADH oxidase family protein [Myxococcales bacterium]|nr:NADH:flavin oxidoreductase/NADH oxidase family protein [Myxococcales bacterium]
MSDLARPLQLPCGQTLSNRIAKAAMSERLAAPHGAPSESLVRLYRQWGGGGAGLLLTGNVMIDRTALGEGGNVILEDESNLDAFRAWARASGPTPLWMQINHPGRQTPRTLTRRPVAPSAVAMRGTAGTFAKPRALTEHEIEGIVSRFGETARLAERAGFAGVQIHGAHGYLISQFLSPLTNRRDDDWGGSRERRRRFLHEVVRAVRGAVSPTFGVSLKLNSADFQRGGFDEDESMEVVASLEGLGLDLLEISGGTYEAAVMFDEPDPRGSSSGRAQRASTQAREAYFLRYATSVRGRTTLPLMVTGGFRSVAVMEGALSSGALDVVGMARPFAVEADIPSRLLVGGQLEAHPVRLATGFKTLDSIIQGGWHQAQIERLARGLDADPKLGRFRGFVSYFLPRRRRETARLDAAASEQPPPSAMGPDARS